MSSPNTIPMIGPDGSVADIPMEHEATAAAKGAKRAVLMVGPDGSQAYLPHDKIVDGIKAGAKPYANTTGLTQFEKDRPGDQGNSILTMLSDLKGLIRPQAQNPYAGMGQEQKAADYQQGVQQGAQRTAAGYNPAYRALAPVAQSVGLNVPGMEQDAAAGNTSGVIGHTAAPVAAYGIGKGIGKVASGNKNVIPSEPETPARTITKAIGPTPNEMNGLEAQVGKSFGNIVEYAKQNKLPMNGRMDLVKAAQAYADSQKAFYDTNVLKPIEGEMVTSPRGFKGNTVSGDIHRTTIGDLESRLRQINTEQASIYSAKKTGGATAEALAKDSELTAEAASIRADLYSEISRRTGLTAEQVGKLRESFGAPRGIADTTLSVLNYEEANGVRASRGNGSVPLSKPGLTDLAVTKLRGGAVKIGDRQFIKALNKASVAPQELPTAVNTPVQRPSQRTPAWNGLDTTGTPVGVDTQIADAGVIDNVSRRATVNSKNRSSLADMLKAENEGSANRLAARRLMNALKHNSK